MPQSSPSTMTWAGRSVGRGRSWRAIVRSLVSTTAGIVMATTSSTCAAMSRKRVRPEPAPCDKNGQRQKHGVDPDIHAFLATSVNHRRADHHQDQADRCQRDEDWDYVSDRRQDQPRRAKKLNESDQSNVGRRVILRPTLTGADELVLGNKQLHQPASGGGCR